MAIPFSQFLAHIRGGVIDNELTKQLEMGVNEAMRNGGKAVIGVQLTVDPHGRENRELHVTAKITAKMPQNPDLSEPSIYFGQRGNLLKDDPDQGKLELDARRELRDLDRANEKLKAN